MKNLNFLSTGIVSLLVSSAVFAGAPTQSNYYHVVQGINSKFDRDYSDLNPQGDPGPGALKIVETFLKAMNTLKVTQPGEYHFFTQGNVDISNCNVASPTCDEMKILVQKSKHTADSTLFGVVTAFDLDIVVWSNSGSGFNRFFEGNYTAVAGTPGKANITVISCSGCSTVGHSQIEWDATGSEYHLRSNMYDTRLSNSPDVYGGVIVDAKYNPTSGEMKMAIAANNVCDSSGVGDSICSGGANDHSSGYAAILHANSITGNVYVQGVQGANNSVIVPTVDAMCLKADKTEDVMAAACNADAISNFAGITAYSPSQAPASFNSAGQPWPFVEITDTPSF